MRWVGGQKSLFSSTFMVEISNSRYLALGIGSTEDRISKYYLFITMYSVNNQSRVYRETHFQKICNISKFAANYVISFEVDDGAMGQNILKLQRQKYWPFGPG